ncbi:MAG: enoyl-CoA hydratase-related protein [Dehalococcoidia bacterium]
MELKATRYAVEERIATITLARPHRLNAWTGRMHTEYRWCLEQAEENSEVRVIIVTGEGRGFCAGADSQALEGHIEKGGYDSGIREAVANPGYGVRPEFDTNFAFHFGLTKPVIAAINGPAAGVGLVLACFADIRFAAAGAKLTTAHGRLGLPAEFGLSWLLPRLIGLSRAQELLVSSRVFLTEEAAEIGLIHQVLPPEELIPAVRAYAANLASRVAPSSMRVTRHQVYTDLHRDIGSSVAESEQLLNQLMRGHDYREGVKALLEKRDPDF